jgi:hypothetical protein
MGPKVLVIWRTWSMFIRIARVDAGLRVLRELFVFNRLWVRDVIRPFTWFRLNTATAALTIEIYYDRGGGSAVLSHKCCRISGLECCDRPRE